MQTVPKIWMDGKLVNWKDANVHVLTHALHYGVGIFEGMRCYNTDKGPAVFRMRDHYQRLINGCKSYQFELKYDLDHLCKATKNLIKVNKLKECYIRPLVFTGYKKIGLDIRGCPFHVSICAIPFGKYFGDKAEKGIKCGISSWRRMQGNVLSPHVKASANYLNSVLAKKEAIDEGYDEAIMLIENGHVAEGSGENLFIVKDGKLITPPLHDGILAGITRDSLIKVAKEMDIETCERSLLRDELYTADEVFLCGTAAEITPVIQIDHRIISKGPGPMTKNLRDSFFKIVKGKDGRFVEWLDFV
ncbi:branched-chain amino acid transaminase [Candidatus Micrarchaeota archaeon]|nr:branched-chain amino acid transaminase [Candidatus Micrarchaeota archaeon]MBU1166083.1 branched-chain amino acid transaminase [Candidatus Micrarchaeota archaeon]MBU1886669.1 branched-chain amino acid transaminase [Candidatus Micrarchaeota archaeon]